MFFSVVEFQCKRVVPSVFAEAIKANKYGWLFRRYNEMRLVQLACQSRRRNSRYHSIYDNRSLNNACLYKEVC